MTDIPIGYCQCGCGQKTSIARKTKTKRHYRKGEPMRYIRGHFRRSNSRHPFSPNESNSERFYKYVDNSGQCWLWTGGRNQDGYGRFILCGRVMNASRASWILAHGPIPAGMDVLHKCDNPPCVRPDHLFLGTSKDNGRDMVVKGRATYAKLKPSQIPDIRRLRKSGVSLKEIAERFGISQGMVSMIANRLAWRDIPD